MFALAVTAATAAEPKEVVIDFEQTEVGKPVPTWTEKGVVFALAGPLKQSQAAGRVMFFPYLSTTRKGMLNAMATDKAIPLKAKSRTGPASVKLVFWASSGCPANLTDS